MSSRCGLATVLAGLAAVRPGANALTVLIAARVLQAIGGSMLNPVAMSIIRNVFVDRAGARRWRSASGPRCSEISMALRAGARRRTRGHGQLLAGGVPRQPSGRRDRRSCSPRCFVPESKARPRPANRPGRAVAGDRRAWRRLDVRDHRCTVAPGGLSGTDVDHCLAAAIVLAFAALVRLRAAASPSRWSRFVSFARCRSPAGALDHRGRESSPRSGRLPVPQHACTCRTTRGLSPLDSRVSTRCRWRGRCWSRGRCPAGFVGSSRDPGYRWRSAASR